MRTTIPAVKTLWSRESDAPKSTHSRSVVVCDSSIGPTDMAQLAAVVHVRCRPCRANDDRVAEQMKDHALFLYSFARKPGIDFLEIFRRHLCECGVPDEIRER